MQSALGGLRNQMENEMTTVHLQLSGDNRAQRYELVAHTTSSVYGTGRPGFGIEFRSAYDRRLISDVWFWSESEQKRDEKLAAAISAPAGSKFLV